MTVAAGAVVSSTVASPGGGGPASCSDALCGVTDPFDRVEPIGLGRSPSGWDWVITDGSYAGDQVAGASVDGSAAVLDLAQAGPGGFAVTAELPAPVIAWPEASVRVRLVGIILTNASFTEDAIRLDFGGLALVDLQYINDAPFGGSVRLSSGGGSTVSVAKNDWTIDWYTVRLTNDGTTMSLYLWRDGDPVPTVPILTCPTDATDLYGTIAVRAELSPESLHILAYVDDLDVRGINRCTAVQFETFGRPAQVGWGRATPSDLLWVEVTSGIGPPAGGVGPMAQVRGTTGATSGSLILSSTNVGNDSGTLTEKIVGPQDQWALDKMTAARATFHVGDTARTRTWAFNFGELRVSWSAASDALVLAAKGSFASFPLPASFFDGLTDRVELHGAWDGATWRVNVWDSTLPEPAGFAYEVAAGGSTSSVDLEVSVGGFGGAPSGIGGGQLVVSQMDFDYLGKPCYLGPCGEAAHRFDDFGRVHDLGNPPFTLGVASSGYAYGTPPFGGGGGPTGLIGTDGSVFYVHQHWNFNQHAAGRHDGTDPWDADQFTLRVRFRTTAAPDSATGVNATIIVGIGSTGIGIVLDERPWDPVTSVGGHIERSSSAFSMPGTAAYGKGDWAPDTWYVAELLYDNVGLRVKLRVYADGTTPPAWQIDIPGAGTRLDTADLGLLVDTATSSDAAWRVELDYIDVDNGAPCSEPVPPDVPGAPETVPAVVVTGSAVVG